MRRSAVRPTITGTVTDPSRAVVPGATVVVINEGTNVTTELVTTEAGQSTTTISRPEPTPSP